MGCGDFSHTYGQREISNEVIYVSGKYLFAIITVLSSSCITSGTQGFKDQQLAKVTN